MAQYLDVSMRRISSLHPKLIPSATRVFENCWKNQIPLYIIWGKRTIEEQELLYRFGRTIPGKVITTHRPGFSAHNYGLALDFCFTIKDKFYTWEDVYPSKYWRNRWFKALDLFQLEDWEIGMRWTNFEPGHVQKLLDFNLTELYEQASNRVDWNAYL